MNKDEPSLAPQWYKPSTGNCNSNNHSNSLPHDDHASGHTSRNLLLLNCDDSPRSSPYSGRNSSSYRRSSSSNGSLSRDKERNGHSQMYSSFGRSHRDRDKDKDQHRRDKDRLPFADSSLHDTYGSLAADRNETLRRSRSMVSEKRDEPWNKRPGNNMNNGTLSGINVVNIGKASFEKDFPSLGAEDKQGPPEVFRVVSPVLSLGAQSFPVNGWTSALVEPGALPGGGQAASAAMQNVTASVHSNVTGTPASMPGLNMAETLAQAPSKFRTEPQLFNGTQVKEKLAREQCAKLVPLTPMQKNNALEKCKSKGARGEVSVPSKSGQQSSQLMSHTFRGTVKSDALKPFAGNFTILNREKNELSTVKNESPSTSSSIVSPFGAVTSTVNGPSKNLDNQKPKADFRALLPSTINSLGGKRPYSQAQNRNDFFKSLSKKSPMNSANPTPDPASLSFPSSGEKAVEITEQPAFAFTEKESSTLTLAVGCSSENRNVYSDTGNVDCDNVCSDANEKVTSSFNSESEEQMLHSSPCLDPDEEAALLHTLGYEGWEKNGTFDPLTREEMDDFAKTCNQLEPSSKLDTRVLRVLQLLKSSDCNFEA